MNKINLGQMSVGSPVGAVAKSWTQRRLLWIPAVVLLLGYVAQWASRGNEVHTSAIPNIPAAGTTLNIQNNVPSKTVDPADVKTVSVTGNLDLFREMLSAGKLPNLRSLTIYASISSNDVRALAALPQLEALQLLDTYGLTSADWKFLSCSPSLKQLRVLEFGDEAWGGEPTTWPPNLELIQLQGSRELSLVRLAELSELPRLHTLAVRLNPQHQTSGLSSEAVACLRRFPALRRLFLLEHRSLFPNLLAFTRHDLPHLSVRSWSYSKWRVLTAVGANCMLTAIFATVLSQLSVQLVGAQSILIPGYRNPHLRVAAWITGVVVLSQVALLLSVECHFLGIVGLLGVNMTFLWLFVRILRLEQAFPGFVQPIMVWVTTMLSHMCVGNVMLIGGADTDWFLQGLFPVWSWLTFAIGLYGAYDTVQWHIALPRTLEARNRGGVPLKAFDVRAWREWDARSRQHSPAASARWRTWELGNQAQLDRVLEGSPMELPRWQLIATGQQMLRWQRFAGVMALALCFAGFQVLRLWNRGGGDLAEGSTMIFIYLCMTPLFVFVMNLTQISNRRGAMAAELLRPMSRSAWVLAWFWIMCRNMLMYLAIAALGAIVFTSFSHTPWDPVVLAALWCVVCALSLAFFGLGMALVTYRWGHWGMWILMGVTCPVISFFFMTTTRHAPHFVRTIGTSALWTVTICLVPFGIATCYMAWRRWHRWEL